MEDQRTKQIAADFIAGRITQDQFRHQLNLVTFDARDGTALDIDRARRCGYPEVIFAEGKSLTALQSAVTRLVNAGQSVLATRVTTQQGEMLASAFADGILNDRARTFRLAPATEEPAMGVVTVVTAGTSDLPVAEEAHETLLWMNVQAEIVEDVGVAGPHRLPAYLKELRKSDAIVVVAGMEGALPSVVGGYVSCPVVAVPTSVGYGASLGGIAALLGMLNSCAANVTVVNIDAGFKAGYVAGLIAARAKSDSQ